jgi:hypothetical protein
VKKLLKGAKNSTKSGDTIPILFRHVAVYDAGMARLARVVVPVVSTFCVVAI